MTSKVQITKVSEKERICQTTQKAFTAVYINGNDGGLYSGIKSAIPGYDELVKVGNTVEIDYKVNEQGYNQVTAVRPPTQKTLDDIFWKLDELLQAMKATSTGFRA